MLENEEKTLWCMDLCMCVCLCSFYIFKTIIIYTKHTKEKEECVFWQFIFVLQTNRQDKTEEAWHREMHNSTHAHERLCIFSSENRNSTWCVMFFERGHIRASVAEWSKALDSSSSGRKSAWVQTPPLANIVSIFVCSLKKSKNPKYLFSFFLWIIINIYYIDDGNFFFWFLIWFCEMPHQQ